MWKARKLSIKGKITVLRSQILPIILYPASVLYTPDDIIEELNSLFFNFIWPNKKHHVKKKVIIKNIEDGGLKMPDIFTMLKAIKLMWIKRLLTKENNFTHIAKLNCNIHDYQKYFDHNMSRKYLQTQPTSFYGQILDIWEEIKHTNLSKMHINDILNEKLCYNKNILSDNKPFTNKKFSTNDISIIHDILRADLSFKSAEELDTLTIMEYNQIIAAIPKEWKTTICLNKNTNAQFKLNNKLEVKIGLNHKHIQSIRCKDFYWHLINRTHEIPTAILKWEEYYYYVNFNWKDIFTLPYKSTSETSLQSMQYQIIHRYFPCNSILNTWNTNLEELCTLCNVEDTLEHYFFNCKLVEQFWKDFFTWRHKTFLCTFNLGAIDVIFGLMNETHDSMISILNYCILSAKKYIIDCKGKGVNCSFDKYCSKLKNRLIIEEYISNINGKSEAFIQKWSTVVECLNK